MTKLKWDRQPVGNVLNSDYYSIPKKGFDKAWHNKRKQLQNSLGIHKDHEIEFIKKPTGPHAGKAICKTCGNKFVTWLPKGSF